MVVAASIAIALRIEQLVSLALADARRALLGLASGAIAAVVAVVDQSAGADRADAVDEETVLQVRADCADFTCVVGVSHLADALAVDELFVFSA